MKLITKKRLYNSVMKVNELAKPAFVPITTAISMGLLTAQPLYAEDIFDRVGKFANSVYLRIVAISTVIAVVCAAIALLVRQYSKHQKAVDEANEWLKRIATSYVLINCLGLIVNFIKPYITNGNWTYTP